MEVAEKPKVIAPILLERTCDAGKSEMTEEQWIDVIRQRVAGEAMIFACWTRFQWYFGSGCVCPECGKTFFFTWQMLKSGKYNVQS